MIAPQKIYSYFDSHYNLKKSSKGWYIFKCPVCNELENRKKMAVHCHYGIVKCWVCGYKATVVDFVAEMEGTAYNDARRMIRESKDSAFKIDDDFMQSSVNIIKEFTEIKLPYGYKPLLEGEGIIGQRARKYLAGRGFDLKKLDRLGIGYCSLHPEEGSDEEDFFGYIIIPFKIKGKLVYYQGRDFMDNYLRYKNPPTDLFDVGKGDLIFNEDALDIYDEVFVLEGWADAVTIGQDAVSTQGWSLSKTQKLKMLNSDVDIFTFVPDAGKDERGISFYKKALQVAMEFAEVKRVRVVNMDKLSEDGKDVNAIGIDKFMELYKKTPIMKYSDLMLEMLSV